MKLVDSRTGHGQKFLAWDGDKWQMPSLLGGGNASSSSAQLQLASVRQFEIAEKDINTFERLWKKKRTFKFNFHLPDESDPFKRTFKALRDDLLATAEAKLPELRAAAKRPSLPAIPIDATPDEIIKKIYSASDGMVIGESHASVNSKEFIIKNLDNLKASGVKTLYSEHLLSEVHQKDLDTLYNHPNFGMTSRLQKFLEELDRSQFTDPAKKYNFYELVKQASKKKIRVVAMDSTTSYNWNGVMYNVENYRQKMMNYYAQDIINTEQSQKAAGEKWIALTGNSHANDFEGVPGLAELTDAIGVRFREKADVLKPVIKPDTGWHIAETMVNPAAYVKSDFVYKFPAKK